MDPRDRLETLEEALGHRFLRRDLLRQALTHSSVATPKLAPSLERLEFLGDRVLGLVIADLLLREFPDEMEGDLARRHAQLVSHGCLVRVACDLDLGASLRVQTGVAGRDGELPPSILEDTLEALIGAVYYDGGLDAARAVIEPRWTPLLTAAPPRDSKTELQEWTQARGRKLPSYETVAAEGPPHQPVFTIEAVVEGLEPVRAQGGSKRAAERAAADQLLARAKAADG